MAGVRARRHIPRPLGGNSATSTAPRTRSAPSALHRPRRARRRTHLHVRLARSLERSSSPCSPRLPAGPSDSHPARYAAGEGGVGPAVPRRFPELHRRQGALHLGHHARGQRLGAKPPGGFPDRRTHSREPRREPTMTTPLAHRPSAAAVVAAGGQLVKALLRAVATDRGLVVDPDTDALDRTCSRRGAGRCSSPRASPSPARSAPARRTPPAPSGGGTGTGTAPRPVWRSTWPAGRRGWGRRAASGGPGRGTPHRGGRAPPSASVPGRPARAGRGRAPARALQVHREPGVRRPLPRRSARSTRASPARRGVGAGSQRRRRRSERTRASSYRAPSARWARSVAQTGGGIQGGRFCFGA